jgi:hypothetical protein
MSGGGGKKGGSSGGQTSTPSLNIPPGLLQSLSSESGLGSFGTSLFNPLASMTNWASNIATGGASTPIAPSQETMIQTGPSITIGTGGPPGHDQWSTSFDPQTGQITFTNSQTGGTFQQWYGSPQAQQYIPAAQLDAWGKLYQNRGATSAGGTNAGMGPQLDAAWNQILSIPGLEAQTQAFTNTETTQGNTLFGQGETLYGKGVTMLDQATTGEGLFPSQKAFVDQAVAAEQANAQQTLEAEGLGTSTASAVLKGEAQQQGAATAGQLVQGNIAAADQTIAAGQNQINLAQTAQKLALAGQELSLGETQTMAQLALGFQGQMWQEAIQGFGTIGQIMSAVGNIYGIDVSGYSAIMNAGVSVQQITAQQQEAQAQLAAQAASSQGQGLGGLFSSLLGGGGGGGGGLGGLFGSIGGLFGAGAAGTGAAVGGSAIAGTVADLAPLVAGLAF